MTKCPRCNGTMRIKDYQRDAVEEMMPCPTCEGEGDVEAEYLQYLVDAGEVEK